MKKHRYPGVQPFTQNDSNLFFGREWDINRLFKLVNVKQLVVLYSKSGLGKSSLINAGLLPKINEETDYKPIIVRFGSYREKHSVPPLRALKEKVSSGSKGKTLLDKLAVPEESLWYYLKNEQLNSESPDEYLLIFDQFEELFTYPKVQITEFKNGLSEALYSPITKYYQSALEDSFKSDRDFLNDEELELLYKPLRLKMLVAIRSDRLSLIDQLKDYIPDILVNTYQLSALTPTQAEEAILQPAYLDGSDFISPKFEYSEEAIQTILSFLTKDGAQNIESFQLQILCEFIEDNIVIEQNDTYVEKHDIGDLKDIFETYYDKLISKLPEGERLKVRKLLEEGLIFEEEEHRLSLYEGQILKNYGIDKKLLQMLVDTHIIRPEPNTAGGFSYEISHDSLVKPILRAYRKRLEDEYREEEEKQRREEYEKYKARLVEKTKKIRRRLIVGGLLATAAVIFGILFYNFKVKSENELDRMQFLATTVDWYNNLVLNFQNENEKDIYVRSPQEALTLRNKALDIGRNNEQALLDSSFRSIPLLMSLNLANHALSQVYENPTLAVQLARESIKMDSNEVNRALLREVLARGNFNLHSFEMRTDNLLAMGFRGESELVAVTPETIRVINIIRGINKTAGKASERNIMGSSVSIDTPVNTGLFGNHRKDMAVVSEDGRAVLTLDKINQKIEWWSVVQDTVIRPVPLPLGDTPIDYNRVTTMAISDSDDAIAIAHSDGIVTVADLESENIQEINLLELTNRTSIGGEPYLEFSRDSRSLLIFVPYSLAVLYDLKDHEVSKELYAQTDQISFSRQDNFFVSVWGEIFVSVEDRNSDEEENRYFEHNEFVKYATSSPDEKFIISKDEAGNYYVWDRTITTKPVKRINLSTENASNRILNRTSLGNSSSRNLEVRSRRPQMPSVLFSESGDRFVTFSSNMIQVWETQYVLTDLEGMDQMDMEDFYVKYNITDLDDEQKIAYNIIKTDSVFLGRKRDDLLQLAANYYDDNNYELAIEFYDRVIDMSEGDDLDLNLFVSAGNSYFGAEKFQQAISYYKEAAEIDSTNPVPLGNLGLTYENLEEDELAIEYHKKALTLDPGYTASLNGIGNYYYENKDYQEAISYYTKTVKSDPSYKWAWRNLGMAQYNLELFDEAYQSLTKVYEIDPLYNIAQEWNMLGNEYYGMRNYDRAYDSYLNAIRVDPEYTWAYYNIGNVEYARGDYVRSYRNFKRALDTDPQYNDAVTGMIDAFEAGKEADAQFAEKLNEGESWILYCKGRVNVRNDSLDAAFADYNKITDRNFKYPKVYDWIELGDRFLNLNPEEYNKPMNAYRKALQLEPNNITALSALADLSFTNRDYKQAMQYQQTITKLNPDNTNDLWTLSWYQLFARDFNGAIRSSQKVIRMDSTQTGVYTNLALGYLFTNQYEQAERVYKRWMNEEYPFDFGLKTFRDAFLKDLDDLEAAGVTNRSVRRIRSMLNEKMTLGNE